MSTLHVRCSQFTLGNPKSHFSTLLFIYFGLFTLAQKKTSFNCCSAPLLFTYCCLVLPITCIALVRRLGHDTGGRVEACGSGLLRRGLNAEFQHSVVYYATERCGKNWKHELMQVVVTLITCCDIACLTFQLPHITTGSFPSHRRQPTTGFFQSLQRLKERSKPSVR